jgi:hypothetical protein
MELFERLRKIRDFQRRHLTWLETLEDFDVVIEIGFHQKAGSPLTYKALLGRNIASVATVRRRVQRLKSLGLVLQTRSVLDRRMTFLTLSNGLLRKMGQFRTYFVEIRPSSFRPHKTGSKQHPESLLSS